VPGPLTIHLLPAHTPREAFEGSSTVVVDVLRASTTITAALASGAAFIDAVATPQAAHEAANRLPGGRTTAVLGGERGGLRIDGFDLGNSPAEYTRERLEGRPLIFTTTHGTAAALHASAAERICFGCFANLAAVVAWVQSWSAPVHILCAGTNGCTSLDDALFAGALADALIQDRRSPTPAADPDAVALYIAAWRHARDQGLAQALAQTRGGRGLVSLGFGADIERAACINTAGVVGQMNPLTGRILAWKPGT
jgi:2-phosphosulfolactate phosphatase